jgi:hypothetical protein
MDANTPDLIASIDRFVFNLNYVLYTALIGDYYFVNSDIKEWIIGRLIDRVNKIRYTLYLIKSGGI